MKYVNLKFLSAMIMILAVTTACVNPSRVLGNQNGVQRSESEARLFDFESPQAVASWVGEKCQITDRHVTQGKTAMTFTLPKWQAGDNEWPQVSIDWNNGQGYAIKDWSHFGKLAFDVWLDGNDGAQTAFLNLELRSKAGANGWATRCVIQPGRDNTVEIALEDVVGTDLANVEQIIIFSSRPPHSYMFTIDNFRLLPKDHLPVADFDLVYPNYREMIFPGAVNLKVTAKIRTAEYKLASDKLELQLTATGGGAQSAGRTKIQGDLADVSASSAKLPAGPVQLTASLLNTTNGEKLISRTWTLRKVTQAEASAIPVYIDANNNAIVDGKAFFPIGMYDNTNKQHLAEIAGSPFNCILAYGTNSRTKAEMLDYLDTMQKSGLKLIYDMNDLFPRAIGAQSKSWEGINGNQQITDAVLAAYRNHPAMLAYYLADELPKSFVSKLEDYYQSVRKGDPGHPCYLVEAVPQELKYWTGCTDVMGTDPYPISTSPVTMAADHTDAGVSAVQGHKPVWIVPQAFPWYQDTSLNRDLSHVPTAEELKTGRLPTLDEERCMTYLTLAHGAKGVIYWCYYRLRVIPEYKEFWAGMKKIAAEVKDLSPVLLSPDDLGTVKYAPSSTAIHTKLKRYNGHLYLIAVNPGETACKVTFDLGRSLSRNASVKFENRSLNTEGQKLTDDFKALGVHVYEIENMRGR